MVSGIYRIVNTFNGKSYVGQTNDLARRKDEHWRKLRSGKHSNKALQKDFDAYKRFFRFEVLEYCDYSNLSAREDYWCNHFEVWKNGYNHQTTGDNRHYAREKDSRNKEGFKSKI